MFLNCDTKIYVFSSDINECEENIHVCNEASEQCVNAPGGYRCVEYEFTTVAATTSLLSCETGYKLNRSTNTCQGKELIQTI